MMKWIFIFIFINQIVHAITPQRYCKNLAAVSCEVLNMDYIGVPSGGGSGHAELYIKYCRDRQFKVRHFPSGIPMSNTPIELANDSLCAAKDMGAGLVLP